jgi:Protein of unknown function (DUF3102)
LEESSMSDLFSPPAAVRPAEDLAALAGTINAEHEAGVAALHKGLAHFRSAGLALLRAKAQCGHGTWLPWLKANVRCSERTAQGYMRLAEGWDRLPTNPQRDADLSLRQALSLLRSPPTVEECQRDLWEQQWRAAGVNPPAVTGQGLRDWLLDGPLGGLLPEPRSGDEPVWEEALYCLLARLAAAHLIKTGDLLPLPTNLDPLKGRTDPVAASNRWVLWEVTVEREAGFFFTWCEAAGISWRKGFRFPRELLPERSKKALLYDRTRENGGDWEDRETPGDEEAAGLFGVDAAGLPEALHNYVVGFFWSFLGLPDTDTPTGDSA